MLASVSRTTIGSFASTGAVAFLKHFGCMVGDMILGSDQEPALASVVERARKLRDPGGGRMAIEQTLVGGSTLSGVIERRTKAVQQPSRVVETATTNSDVERDDVECGADLVGNDQGVSVVVGMWGRVQIPMVTSFHV